MENLIAINQRGALTLPKEIRKQVGFLEGGHVSVQITNEGILLIPVASYPIEFYSKEKIQEFDDEEAKLADYKLK